MGDVHGDCVFNLLATDGVDVVRVTADSLRQQAMAWSPASQTVTLCIDGQQHLVDEKSAVWWRRPGSTTPLGPLGDLEERLVSEEMAVLHPGVLEAVGVRWVDAPWVISRARLKPVQLRCARRAGARVPDTLVTGCASAAARFCDDGPVVAKAMSSGRGIAPFVDVVPSAEVHRVEQAPTMLQRLVVGSADLRIVTVGPISLGWTRDRTSNRLPDWRADDPAGTDFRAISRDPTEGLASLIAEGLGLSFSVQDWLLTSDGPVFLEVNPQGQWLFLRGAERTVAPALARHLVSG